MHCRVLRMTVDTEYVERKSKLIRTIREGLMEQIAQLEELTGIINEKHTLIVYGQVVFILTNGARALMDLTDCYTIQELRCALWWDAFPSDPHDSMFTLLLDNRMILRFIPFGIPLLPNNWRSSL